MSDTLIIILIAISFIAGLGFLAYAAKKGHDFYVCFGAMLLSCASIGIGHRGGYENGEEHGILELYRGNYKVEIMNSYVDSVLIKSDTLIVKL